MTISEMSRIGFGGAALTSMRSWNSVRQLIHSALDLGIRHFDTARLYGKGYSEVIYGKLLKAIRSEVTITTKFGLGKPDAMGLLPVSCVLPLNYYAKSALGLLRKRPVASASFVPFKLQIRKIDVSEVQTSIETSLKCLQTDYIDYYLLHEAIPSFLTDEARAYIDRLQQQGVIRMFGIGTNVNDLAKVARNELDDYAVLQYDMTSPQECRKLREEHPTKLHFLHSVVRGLGQSDQSMLANDPTLVGCELARVAKEYPNGKVIFSTRHLDRLRANLASFARHYSNG